VDTIETLRGQRGDPGHLFQDDRVHRDVYTSPEIFALEQERLFARTWLFLGHASQVPKVGDLVTTEIAGRPLILVRAADKSLQVVMNRCAHKGAKVLSEPAGNTGRAFRCPYHGWSYRLDGSLLGLPLQKDYEGTRLRECETGKGLHRVASAEHRGFVFVRLGDEGPSFKDYVGNGLSFLDMMADRSPEGELEAIVPPLRAIIRCNWKIYLENINDALHVFAAHEPTMVAGRQIWSPKTPDEPRPMSVEQLAGFQSSTGFEFVEKMGARVMPDGHSILGLGGSVHSHYGEDPAYLAAMTKAYGEERAKAILSYMPQNAVIYPSLAMKGSPQVMRVLRPLAADRTMLEAWCFRAKGAPPMMAERSMLYNRLVFSPMSLVAQDDVHVFETAQKSLGASGNPWVSLHRGHRPGENGAPERETSGIDEIVLRNQHRAWAKYMAPALAGASA
jgi:phenylpropionate dioxygenase-like ring-hydroxylating dioxygenase large terminal subunit